jgi:hypothetical protein
MLAVQEVQQETLYALNPTEIEQEFIKVFNCTRSIQFNYTCSTLFMANTKIFPQPFLWNSGCNFGVGMQASHIPGMLASII